MEKEKILEIRENLIALRNECLGPKIFSPDGAIILSHAIHCLQWLADRTEFVVNTD